MTIDGTVPTLTALVELVAPASCLYTCEFTNGSSALRPRSGCGSEDIRVGVVMSGDSCTTRDWPSHVRLSRDRESTVTVSQLRSTESLHS